jgi:tetratricopeptide (TPR) repeat protein
MISERGDDFEFTIIVSRHFQKAMEKRRELQEKRRIYESLSLLARGFPEWRRLGAKKIELASSGRFVRSARINDNIRILFEGPIATTRFGRILFVHSVCDHDEYLRTLRRIAETSADEEKFSEVELTEDDMKKDGKALKSETVVFSKPIPAKVLLSPERIDAIMSSNKANLMLTQKQKEPLLADRPLLIHGQAGSGKTTLLCHRLAISIDSRRGQPPSRLVFLSYNDKLVEQAYADTREILRDQYDVSDSLEGVEFIPFQSFLKRYVPNPGQFEIDHYVPFSRFKQYYEMYRRGNPAAKGISAEVAWHGIRSILKGACVPPSHLPLSLEAYSDMARRRKDLPQEMFDNIYKIGEWYQKEVIQDKGLWDDQDLAWAGLNWVTKEKERNPEMLLYDEIFCDEGQDLTEIEFRLLVALCKQPKPNATEGLPLVFAGDPLQTINPTGFRWSIVGSEVYRVQGKAVKLHELRENFRSDKRIVTLANCIQQDRAYYMGTPFVKQEAFEKDGDSPQIMIADARDEISFIKKKLGDLPPESAVIVWPEENDAVTTLVENEEALSTVDRELNLFTISEAKGLEFRLVVLYKFGSSPDVVMWKEYLGKKRRLSSDLEIPFLYFLNRLYVAVTRAKLFLVLVDTKAGVENFWSIWKDAYIYHPRPKIRKLMESHPAFKGEVSDAAWRSWAETLFEQAERERDKRLYERAKRAFEKANDIQRVKEIDARIMELDEKWEKAGELYFELNEFEPARNCYDKAGMWSDAYTACTMLPTTPQTKRWTMVYKFRMGPRRDKTRAAIEFYDYALTDDSLDEKDLDDLGKALIRARENEKAARVFLRVARSFNDKEALAQAALSFYKASDFRDAEPLFAEAREIERLEYQISRAENLLQKGNLVDAAQLFFDNNGLERVLDIYKNAIAAAGKESGTIPEELLKLAADSSFKIGKYDIALLVYQRLYSETGMENKTEIAQRIAECYEKLGEKSKAYDFCTEVGLYAKAADLAQELGRPREEILSLKIEAARKTANFDEAVKFALEKGDEKLAHELRGHSHNYRKEYLEAVQEFIQAEEWNEALNGLDLFAGSIDYSQSELHDQQWNIVRAAAAVAASQQTIRVDKEKMMRVVRQLRDEPAWVGHISPREMGLIFEYCAASWESSGYYESYIQEQWAREGWLRVMSAYRDSFRQKRDFKNAEMVDDQIRRYRNKLGF